MRKTHLQPFLACSLLGAVLISGLDGQPLAPIAPVKPAGMPFIRSYRSDTVPPLRVSDSSRLHAMIRGRPVAQRAGPLRRRPPDAVLGRGGPGGRVHPPDRAGRLLLPAEDRRPDAWTWLTFPAAGVDRRRRGLSAGPSAQGRRVSRQPGRSGRRGRGLGACPRHELDERLQSADADVRFFRAALVPSGEPASARRAPMAWLGLPGRGLGGMDPQTSDPVAWSGRYDFAPGWPPSAACRSRPGRPAA